MSVEHCHYEGCTAQVMAGRGLCGHHGGLKKWQELLRKAENAERREQVNAERNIVRAKHEQRRQRRRLTQSQDDPRFRRLESQRKVQGGSSRAGGAPMTGLKALARIDAEKRKRAEAEVAAKSALKQAKAKATAKARRQSKKA